MKNVNRKTLLLSLLLSTLLFGVSVGYAKGMPFAKMDIDKSGTVSEQEFNTVIAKRRGLKNAPKFADFDTNNDGQLTPEEIETGQQARMQSRSGRGMRGMGM